MSKYKPLKIRCQHQCLYPVNTQVSMTNTMLANILSVILTIGLQLNGLCRIEALAFPNTFITKEKCYIVFSDTHRSSLKVLNRVQIANGLLLAT